MYGARMSSCLHTFFANEQNARQKGFPSMLRKSWVSQHDLLMPQTRSNVSNIRKVGNRGPFLMIKASAELHVKQKVMSQC